MLDAAATGALIALTEAGAPTVALVLCGARRRRRHPERRRRRCARCGRSCCARRDELLPTAFALDSVAIELLFTVGPADRRARSSPSPRRSPRSSLSAGCSLAGTLLFVTPPAVARVAARRRGAGTHGALGALRSQRRPHARVRRRCPVGLLLRRGRDQPARVRRGARRAPSSRACCSPTWAVASAVGGLAYGARTWRRPLPARLPLAVGAAAARASCPRCSPARSRRWRC